MKTLIATGILLASAPVAIAGPYVNVENNAGWSGSDYNGAVTDLHVGYEGSIGEDASWYVQGGPAIVSVDGEDNSTEISGKLGANFNVTDKIGIYGELSAISDDGEIFGDDFGVGTKLGAKYTF